AEGLKASRSAAGLQAASPWLCASPPSGWSSLRCSSGLPLIKALTGGVDEGGRGSPLGRREVVLLFVRIDCDEEDKVELREIHVAGPEAFALAALGARGREPHLPQPAGPLDHLARVWIEQDLVFQGCKNVVGQRVVSQALVKVAIWTKIRCRSATSIVTPVAHSPSSRYHTTTYY